VADDFEPADECDGADYDDDRYDEYKDNLAMGYINPDGSQRDPDEPDFGAEEYAEHCDEVHGGKACDCPKPDPWVLPEGETYAEEAPF
jgi:hypothetical protein